MCSLYAGFLVVRLELGHCFGNLRFDFVKLRIANADDSEISCFKVTQFRLERRQFKFTLGEDRVERGKFGALLRQLTLFGRRPLEWKGLCRCRIERS